MDFSEVRDCLDQACEFPVEHETLVERVGELDIEAPTTDSETVETVLDRTGDTTYHSVDEAYTALIGTVSDAYIGPKRYDDRAGARSVSEEEPVSF